jgi:hypothetical protein
MQTNNQDIHEDLVILNDELGIINEIKQIDAQEPIITEEQNEVIKEITTDTTVVQNIVEPVVKKGNAEAHYPLGHESNKDSEKIALPTGYGSDIKDSLSKLPNINLTDSPSAREWVRVLNEGLEYIPMQEMFKETVENKTSEFTQKPEYNGKPLIAASPKFEKMENNVLKGEKAVIRVLQTLGLGNLFQVPLWHSGIWVTIKPPTEAEIIELNRQLINDKIQFGRYTYGLAFANTTAYTTERLVNFVLEHIYNTTINTESLSGDDLKKMINSQDIPILLWGIICTIYPNGYKYQRSCIANPEECNHVIEETINVTKLLWTNLKNTTDYQKDHMSHRQARSRTLDQIQRYKDELSQIHKTRVKIDNDKDIYITIKSPSIFNYINSGHSWITSIVDTVEKTINSEANGDEKETLITRYAQASRLRQYSHWIESIEIETNISNDQETTDEILNIISSDDQLFSSIMLKIKDYINNSVMSLIGIPSFNCPKCNKEQIIDVYPQFTNIIPLDVQQTFFALFTQRLIKLTDR